MLNWLISQASKVYDWFGGAYWTVKQAVSNIGTSIATAMNSTYTSLTNFVKYIQSALYQYIDRGLSDARAWVSGLFSSLDNSLGGVRTWVTDLFNDLKSWASNGWNTAISGVASAVESVKTWFTQALNNERGERIGAIGTLSNLINPWSTFIGSLQALFNPTNLNNLRLLLVDKFSNLMTFLSDPLGVMVAILWSPLLTILNFALAYALGTTKYSLPPIPAWSTISGEGGAVDPSLKVIKPVTPLWISGYSFNNPQGHKGVDLGIYNGQPIYAAHNGRIIEAGISTAGYGIYIILSGGDWWTRYGHLKALGVVVGQEIAQGSQIGLGDTTGNSTGNHLHFEVRYKGIFVDPMQVIQ